VAERRSALKHSVIVTGASGGIGSKICQMFENEGYIVIGVDRVPSKWTLGNSYDLANPDVHFSISTDFAVGNLLTIVHAAAEQVIGRLENQEPEVWQRLMWTNVMALDNLVRQFSQNLSRNLGSVVLIGSIHALVSRSEIAMYAITKAAGEGWVKSASIEYAPHIRINSVMPGAIESGKLLEYVNQDGESANRLLEKIARRTPMKRLGRPDDIANAVRFLASQQSSFITGQTLIVDGGATRLLATEVE